MNDGGQYVGEDASELAGELFSGKLTAEEALKRLRARLLDLSMRNRLLNYRHPKGRSIQFIGRLDIDGLHDRLLDGKKASLDYVPDPPTSEYDNGKKPEIRAYAKRLGISTSVDIALGNNARARSDALQTLHYPADLERFTRKLANEARVVVEETGTNMLHLMFGFLEFYETDDSDKPAVAPLVAMPVKLEKGDLDSDSRTYRYSISSTGEDVVENFSLREKLKQEFRLQLPELEEDDTPEAYFVKVSDAIAKRHRWKVLQRISLGFLSFGKLALWVDLDPAKSEELLANPLLRSIFEGGNPNQSEAFHAEDYEIDQHQDGDLPLIYDADSSQHSAIIDVKAGKSLVINGPPGTGKSQTITNVIASSMAAGKKILFVSEKLAALQVVKHRLEMAGLGDFCLELHSHKSQKKQLLAGIEHRIGKRFRAVNGYESKLDALKERKRTLNKYAHVLGSRIENQLGLTVHEIFWAAERRRIEAGEFAESVSNIRLDGVEEWAPRTVDKCRAALAAAAAATDELGACAIDSPWRGFVPRLMVHGDELPVIEIIDIAKSHAGHMVKETEALGELTGKHQWSFIELENSFDAIASIAEPAEVFDGKLLDQMLPQGLVDLKDALEDSQQLSNALRNLRELDTTARMHLSSGEVEDAGSLLDAEQRAGLSLSESALQQPLVNLATNARVLLSKLQALESLVVPHLAYPRAPDILLASIESLASLPSGATIFSVDAAKLRDAAVTALRESETIQSHLRRLGGLLAAVGLPPLANADEVEALGRGEIAGLKDTEADAALHTAILKDAAGGGCGDWPADRFTAQAADYVTTLRRCREAQDYLKALSSRLELSYAGTREALAQLGAVVQIAEDAPKDLLGFRSSQFERPDFADLAIRAEEAHKGLGDLQSSCEEIFELDRLPDLKELKEHARALRRPKSLFNIFRSDWRRARRLYQDCAKRADKVPALRMAERIALAVKWREAHRSYNDSEEFRAALGGLFLGTKTDYQKVRRLHSWYRKSSQLLFECGLAGRLAITSLDQHAIGIVSAQAVRCRSEIKALEDLFDHVSSLKTISGIHAAASVDDLARILDSEIQRLKTIGDFLSKTVEPQVTINRAMGLLSIKRRLAGEAESIQALEDAPARLRELGRPLGLQLSTFDARELGQAASEISRVASSISRVADEICAQLCDQVTPEFARSLLLRHNDALSCADGFVSDSVRCESTSWSSFLLLHKRSAEAARDVTEVLALISKPISTARDAMKSAMAAIERDKQLQLLASNERLSGRFGDYLRGLATSESCINACLSWAVQVSNNRRRLPPALSTALLKHSARQTFLDSRDFLQRATSSYAAYKAEMEELRRFGQLSWPAWGNQQSPQSTLDRLAEAHDAAVGLIPWSKYCDAQQEAIDLGLGQIIEVFEQGLIAPAKLVTAFELVLFRSLSKQILTSRKDLARFTGGGHERLRSEFAALDKELISLNGAQYAYEIDKRKKVPSGIDRGKAGDLTEMALLSKETKKQKRHIPIRQLLRRAGKALQELKPCFMMGPLSVAQYLEHGLLEFDLVVMDEASQLRPEDALGAIARGKQLVVVGDPKQLPPTNFFDRLMDADDEDAEETPAFIDGMESILGICEHLYRPVRTLRWHYRSRHESLIAFSNSQFYSSRLVVFPSPYKRNRFLGVNYRYVRDGIYQDRKNLPEAMRVVNAVVDHMLNRPSESLGVVTLNQTQRDLIQDLLDKKFRDVDGVGEYLAKHEEEGWDFFVKNLENVQGDERDVIFISTTFGKPPGTSVVRQTFGPINRPDGWRRLNVLFTRARSRLEVFTSMLPTDVIVDDAASLGRKALRDYLEYAKSGSLPAANIDITDREPDSDFEISVADALQKLGYDTQPQVGVAGYFIDIGVRHPERRGEFLAGIECDGASYHSSVSARDRDRIRQEILESLGWRGRIIRVWSTDWFSDPMGQTKRLARLLEERVAQGKGEIVPYADDDLEIFTEVEGTSPAPDIGVTNEDDTSSRAADVYVEVGDRVTYSVAGEQQVHTVQIVDSASNPKHGLLNENTPVALALLGLTPGEEAEFAVVGQPSRTVRLIKIHREATESEGERIQVT